MNQDLKNIVIQFITLPLVLKVFKRDKNHLDDFKTKNVYLDKLDAVIESVQSDFNNTKQQMYSMYHVDVQQLNQKGATITYQWKTPDQNGVIELSSSQFRELTKNKMQEYLYGSLAKPHKEKERSWYE